MIKIDKKALRGGIFLFVAALFWGSAFVAQKLCENSPFSTNALRFLFGAVLMLPIALIYGKIELKYGMTRDELKVARKQAIKGGTICGISQAIATTLQQVGLADKALSAGKSGFLTATYMVMIPIIGLFFGKKVGLNVWCAVVLAIVGAFLMSYNGTFSMGWGGGLTLGCALAFAINVIMVDKYVHGADCIFFSMIQMLVAGIICSIAMIIVIYCFPQFETFNLEIFKRNILPILYIAIFSCCIAYTCQVVGQKDTPPAIGAVIMSLESVFSLIFSLTLGGPLGNLFGVDIKETLTLTAIFGIICIFMAVMLAQFNPFYKLEVKLKNNKKVVQKVDDTDKGKSSNKDE